MSENLSAAAQALGIPEPLVQRSAAARAAETGADVEDILAAWAGGEAAAPTPAPEPAEEPAEVAEVEAEEGEGAPEEEERVAAEEPEPPPPSPVEMPAPAPAAAATAPPPAPTEVDQVEATRVPVVVTVPTSNLKERTSFTMPRWLAAVLIAAPLFALFALGGSATGTCGEATELRIDVITGQIVNCDGTEFTGSAIGGGADFVSLGARIYAGGEVAGVNCAGCHAATGQGLGAFPALTGALTTFGACPNHVEWVSLGTQGFENAGESTYGDTAKPLRGAGVMPGFAGQLTPEQIAAVSAFERVRFGGAEPEATLVDCGLAEEAPAEGEEGADGEDIGTEQPGEAGTEGNGQASTEGDGTPTTTSTP